MEDVVVTVTAPVNIAVIKYWGKRDEKLHLPLNGSLSGTLNQKDLKTITTLTGSKSFSEDEIWLNGKKEDVNIARIQNCLKEIRSRAGKRLDTQGAEIDWSQYRVKIVSINNFPTAAGLASSASGYAALVFGLSQLYSVSGDVTGIARLGSGSACRSLYGGWVKWNMGSDPAGSDSIAVQTDDEKHWPEMRVLVCVVNDKKKETSSSDGMQNSVRTSKLLKTRAESVVEPRLKTMEQAIHDRDFQTFGDLTMKDSDDFHAVCADTTPPIYYLNDTSRFIIDLIHRYNKTAGKIQAAYTFDAGPNAVIYLEDKYVPEVLAMLSHFFPPSADRSEDFIKDATLRSESEKLREKVVGSLNASNEPRPDGLKYILCTSLGPGPQVLGKEDALPSPN
eukprot:TRINITY_DN448_c0_g1_i1.p1 TRINITY_DN448_c0_g1~~TRINITY_DN448_c0_g1_i1.p1  ORF type:complete len:401 (-),score=102.27 TRINITY_DN448_c0_g1_i1:133-1308(-)